jgi:hypothetical protein
MDRWYTKSCQSNVTNAENQMNTTDTIFILNRKILKYKIRNCYSLKELSQRNKCTNQLIHVWRLVRRSVCDNSTSTEWSFKKFDNAEFLLNLMDIYKDKGKAVPVLS